MKFTVILILCFLAVATVTAKPNHHLEPLAGLQIENGMLNFKVKSTGCTSIDNFEVHYLQNSERDALQIVRIKSDRCRRMPHYLWLSLPLEAQQQTFSVLNPFLTLKPQATRESQ
ncbi:MAG: hypothetical protein MI867_16480 [Pseudomonadales bacterium]|nr:hypothetical protein [Pseudomonadales bacterium]